MKKKSLRKTRQPKHLYLYVVLTSFCLLVVGIYLKQSASILGVSVESPGKQGETSIPVQPTITVPTNAPMPTTFTAPTDTPIILPPTQPTPITPKDPIFVPVEETPSSPSLEVDITKDTTSVVIENKTTGLDTTVQTFMPVIQPSAPKITQAETSAPVTQTQVYIMDPQTSAVTVDPAKTIPIVNTWLALNEIKVSPVEIGKFEIGKGGVMATVSPLGNQIGVNLSRMELSIKTETGFKRLSYLADTVVEYLQDSSLISGLADSKDTSAIILEDSSTDLRYQVSGISKQYLIAFIPIDVPITICVSAQTKDICGIKQSLLSRAVDMLSL